MSNVYIAGAKRTAIGSFLGSLKNVSAAELGATVIKGLVSDLGLNGADFDEVIVGNILSAGAGQGIGRQAAIKGGIPQDVPAYSVNMLCGSGMKSVMLGCNAIGAGANLIMAGGVESMSRSPMLFPYAVRGGTRMGDIKIQDSMVFDALTDAFSGVHMGITAENLAKKYNISREEQDEFAINSQAKAIAAQDAGRFKDEITPVTVVERRNEFVFDTDEYINRDTSLEKLKKLRPAFMPEGGTVTAGNASGINDAASFVVLASEAAVKKHKLKPLARIIGIGQAGVDPQIMGIGPVPAVKNALINANKKLADMDLIELNEAFAAQSLAVMQELCREHGVSREFMAQRTNVNGGAIALGHPVGASGNRIIVTLLHQMRRAKAKLGLASLCIGGGMGTAVVVESL